MRPDPPRSEALAEILRLDPVRDHVRIVYLDFCYEFPFESLRSHELALFRTFASPTIARLLDRTGEFRRRPQKRYDDTDLFLSTIVEWGYESERGKRAIERLNRIHGRYDIDNEDMLYVLSTFVFEPARFVDRWGWRRLVPQERRAGFELWRRLGERLGIRDVPQAIGAFETWSRAYERSRFRFDPACRRVAEATLDIFLARLPGPVRAFGRQGLLAFFEEPVLEAFGFPSPPSAVRAAVDAALRARAAAVAALPRPRRPVWRTQLPHPTYPRGFTVEELGPTAG